MNLSIVQDDGTVRQHKITPKAFQKANLYRQVGYIGTQSKEQNALNILEAYFSDAKAILLDETNKGIVQELSKLKVNRFGTASKESNIFQLQEFSLLYFTSGSTGSPVGALKSKRHIGAEIKALRKLLLPYRIKKVLVTVPFVHLYGTLLGLMYPLFMGIEIVLKEHFLPHDLLEMVEEGTMVVTTPLYIKALNKLGEHKDLSKAVFISSTAPLDKENIQAFNQKFQSDILQIFGSTETGGIAYKINNAKLWKPFEGVKISSNHANELKVSSPFVSETLYEKGFKETQGELQTFDYIEEEAGGFRLLGRSSKIFKLAGKRYSTIQIENILESIEGISKALVFVGLSKEALRGEYLEITIESNREFTNKEIKSLLRRHLSNLKFSIHLKRVQEIPLTMVGKKLRIEA